MDAEKVDYDVMIVGGGPAGISASVWCRDVGLRSILFEKNVEFGGQLNRIYGPITNYPGLAAENGRALCERFTRSLEDHGGEAVLGCEVAAIGVDPLQVQLADGRTVTGRFLIFATGVRRRKLNIPGEEEFSGKGVLRSGSENPEAVRGRSVVIIGGGDAALENAVILAPHASKVRVVHRGSEFSARLELVDAAARFPNVSFIFRTIVTRIGGGKGVEYVELRSEGDSPPVLVDIDFVLIRIGVEANGNLAAAHLKLDVNGYIQVDGQCRTSVEGIYAVGDIANPISPTIGTAVGAGATAVKSAVALLNRKKNV